MISRHASLAAVALLALSACFSEQPGEAPNDEASLTRLLKTGSESEIERAAMSRASADFKAGHPQIAYAGTESSWSQGVPANMEKTVAALPHLHLPCGCTDPLALPAITFARTYNHEMLHLLASAKQH